MKDYQVGQVLFLIGDSNKVFPIQVVEEVIRTTLEGKEKTYIVKLPDKKETTIDIKKLKGDLFTDKKEVRDFMMRNASDAINSMIRDALNIANSLFGVNTSIPDEPAQLEPAKEENIVEPEILIEKVQPEVKGDIIKVDLGNGKFGKMSVADFNQAGAPQ